jgi:hypothetical protein
MVATMRFSCQTGSTRLGVVVSTVSMTVTG